MRRKRASAQAGSYGWAAVSPSRVSPPKWMLATARTRQPEHSAKERLKRNAYLGGGDIEIEPSSFTVQNGFHATSHR